jgi:type I restriction enzyme M protein
VTTSAHRKDPREVIDITSLNAELKTTVSKIDKLRAEIDVIVAEIRGEAR